MKQYLGIKAKYPGALLLFRVGDFYETFGEDAVKTARILDIVLTKRSNGKASEVELAGFPHHALDTYLPKLVRAGERVAICDQLEDPKLTKTIVKRGVTELITPGVAHSDKVLESRSNNFLAAVYFGKDIHGICLLDISTGEFMVAEGNSDYIDKLLQGFRPSEVIFSKKYRDRFDTVYQKRFYTYALDEWVFAHDFAMERLTRQFEVQNLKGFGIEHMEAATIAAGAALYYLEQTHHNRLEHIRHIARIEEDRYVWLDPFTIRNLEIIQSSHPNGRSLLDVLDHTLTPMGGRLLKQWMVLPLKNLEEIKFRHNVVELLVKDEALRTQLAVALKPVHDLERLISKVSLRRVNPRELLQLARSLGCIREIIRLGSIYQGSPLSTLSQKLQPCNELAERLEQEIREDAPVNLQKGEVFKRGVYPELDSLQSIVHSGRDFLIDIQRREAERTGISSLKIGFNNVFGYYLEVTHTHKNKVPGDWIRKQTLTNAERYITPELKEYEDKILGAEDRISELEARLFEALIAWMDAFVQPVQQNARILAELDCLLSFAQASVQNSYHKPSMNEGFQLALHECRHPVIEQQLGRDETFIPNDLLLDNQKQQLMILTGPNMSGKSALLRQTALAVLMAQCGCFVAAKHAEIGLIDKIYTRVGASDNISQGESTFMVEMTETASILNNLSSRSLILLDEIGRGTSTYDGVSLAWAIAEYIHQHETHPKTIFATHYHELNELEELHQGIVNYHISTRESGNKVIFLRKLVKGGSEHSFGIHVARMAGIPKEVVKRSSQILGRLEQERAHITGRQGLKKMQQQEIQLNLFRIDDPQLQALSDEIHALDVNTLTPVEALLKLNELKNMLKRA